MSGAWIQAVVAVVGVLVLLFALSRLLQRGWKPPGNGPQVPLRLLRRVAIGPKQGVGLLQVADRVLVISIAETGARLLTELDEEAEALLKNVKETPPPAPVWKRWLPLLVVAAGLALATVPALAQESSSLFDEGGFLPPLSVNVGEEDGGFQLKGAVGLVVFIGLLTLIPAILLLMTSFTRILIVLQFLRPAMGTQNTPPGQLLTALAVLLTGVVMHPVLLEVNADALQPYFDGEITQAEAYERGVKPFRTFMLDNVGEGDLALFAEMSGVAQTATSIEEIPTLTIVSAFVTSELRTAFQMGFLIFLPFIVVDLVVASTLMSLGMFMLPPMMISLPFKLLLFVLADGWTMLVKNLVLSFG